MSIFDKAKKSATFWLGHRLPTCVEITELLSQSMERSLTVRERLRLRLHFLICDPCSLYERGLHFIRATVRGRASHDAGSSEGLSPEARQRMKALLAQEPREDQ